MKDEFSPIVILLLGLDSGESNMHEVLADITRQEYQWEPLPLSERSSDLCLPPERKKVWRVFPQEGKWVYDYTIERLSPPPFTTIAWIMNHVAQTAEMYLYCIKTGQPEGLEKHWEDLPVPASFDAMRDYLFRTLIEVRSFLVDIPTPQIDHQLTRLTPAPWGELRPTYINLWGGIAEHVLQHAMQIAARKDRIRYGH